MLSSVTSNVTTSEDFDEVMVQFAQVVGTDSYLPAIVSAPTICVRNNRGEMMRRFSWLQLSFGPSREGRG